MPFRQQLAFESPAAAPALLDATPAAGATSVPRTAWLRLRFASPPSNASLAGWDFGLECDGERIPRRPDVLADGALILNPKPELPPGADCRVIWRGPGGGVAEHGFRVAANAALAAEVHYDRGDALRLAPFPDDYWAVPDASTPTGVALELPLPPFPDLFQQEVFAALAAAVGAVDGWSRQPPIVLAFSHDVDLSAVPADAAASADPFAPVALLDVDPGSPDYGERIPYRMLRRSDFAPTGGVDRVALLFPAVDLRERGRYAVVVTRRVFAQGAPGAPFRPSAFFADLLEPAQTGESAERARARASVEPVLDALEGLARVPIPREDVALAVRLTVRSHPDVSDMVAIKEQALAGPPPALILPSRANPCPSLDLCITTHSGRTLEVRGRVRLPNYRDAQKRLVRDPVTGRPQQTGTADVPFVLTLPPEALDGPVVPVMHQHGNPSCAEEVTHDNQELLDDAGFAVLGFTDALNREYGHDIAIQTQGIFFTLVLTQALPWLWLQTASDQIHFLRAIQGMGGLDLLRRGPGGTPAIGPDGMPEIDPTRILYTGISEGGNHAQRFLPFAPELSAAVATVGGGRLGDTLIHQNADGILDQLSAFLPLIRPVELWVGLSLFQAAFDPQDGHTFLRHMHREPLLPFAGSDDAVPPSTLWIEGTGDTYVPNNASRAAAIELGLPHVRPLTAPVPGLAQVDAPVSGNLGPGLTTGYFQYAPATTPWCDWWGELEPHFCAQSADEAKAQRLHFLETGLDGAAEIIDPF
jgi:hypothetical protein